MEIKHNDTYTMTLTGSEFRELARFVLPKISPDTPMSLTFHNVISAIRQYGEDFVDNLDPPSSGFVKQAKQFVYDPKKSLLKIDPNKSIDEAEEVMPDEFAMASAGDIIRVGAEQAFKRVFGGDFLPFTGSEWIVSGIDNPPSSMTVEHPISHELYIYHPSGDRPYTIVKRPLDCTCGDDERCDGCYNTDEVSAHEERAQVGDVIKLNLEKLSKFSVPPSVVYLLGDGEYKVNYVNLSGDGIIVYEGGEKVFLPHDWYTIVKRADQHVHGFPVDNVPDECEGDDPEKLLVVRE